MKKFVSFSDIKQFRNVIKDINFSAKYVGKDDDGEPIYDQTIKNPTISFKGTVKLHGTNAGVSYNKEDGIWFQKRTSNVTIEKDNAGFAFFGNHRIDAFQELFNKVTTREKLTDNCSITIFGEWCGGNIQKGVALNQVEKMFVIFAVKVTPYDEEECAYYVDCTNLADWENQIYNIANFKTYKIDIDFENPLFAQNKMIKLVEEVEKECPVAKAFKVSGIGEGIVWEGYHKENRYIFKTKGEKHSISKVKTLAPVDTEKLNSIFEFVEYAVTKNRLEQGIEQVFIGCSVEPDITKMGDFLRWVMRDIIKEETDVMNENKLSPKEIGRDVSKKARTWFIDYLDNLTMEKVVK